MRAFSGKNYRLKEFKNKNIDQLIDEWSLLKHSKCSILIDVDFGQLFPGKENNFFVSWPKFTEKANDLSLRIKNRTGVADFSKSQQTSNENFRDYIFLKLLHCIIKPKCRICKKGNKKNWKPSIADSQYSQILHLQTINDLQRKIEERQERYKNIGLQMQPFLIVVEEGDSFYVWCEKLLQKFDSLVKSLDFCFKLFHCFNLKYSKESELVWLFVQKYFYCADLNEDIESTVKWGDLKQVLNIFLCYLTTQR